jgi:hypothetical protein
MNIDELKTSLNELYNEEMESKRALNEGLFKNKKKEEDEDDDFMKEWSEEKIKSRCKMLKDWLDNPSNLTYQKASKIFPIANILNLHSTIEKKMKSINYNSKDLYNWDDIVKLLWVDRFNNEPITNEQYKEFGLINFPEAKTNKLLVAIFDNNDYHYFMSKKTCKIIDYDYKNRFGLNSLINYIKRYDNNKIDSNKVKEIWKEIK